jgi:hypothetical protein
MSRQRRTTSELATAQPKASEKKNTNIKQHFVLVHHPDKMDENNRQKTLALGEGDGAAVGISVGGGDG